ncbi:MAG: hypothetical protein MUC95_01415, partial [Spirochaetes bacterium]|nr:hypothetical protein [Spirochaetota bacterium]
MAFLKKNILSLFLLIALLSLSCKNDTDSIHVRNWMLLYTQDQSLESVSQKSGWEPVAAPSNIKLPYPLIRGFQYVWIRGDFKIKDEPSRYYGLSTGCISFSDRVFINNKLIGSLPPEKIDWTPLPRNYVLPQGILKTGNNVLYIQLGVYGDGPGGISEEVLVQDKEEFSRAQLVTNLIYYQLPFGIMFLYL